MKISELEQLSALQRDILIPISVSGQNFRVRLGQILDQMKKAILHYSTTQARPSSVNFVAGNDTITNGTIIYDTANKRFYMAVKNTASGAGSTIESWTYYQTWNGSWQFFDDDGKTSRDAIFCDADGKFYVFDGNQLIRAGMTQEEMGKLTSSSWKKVTEEEMDRLVQTGATIEGQVYYSTEE